MNNLYDSELGTNIRAHLISKGIETPITNDTYTLTEKERITQIERNLEHINSIMGIDHNTKILAENLYNDYYGQSYKKFPRNIYGFNKDKSLSSNYLIHSSFYKCSSTWQKKSIYLVLEWNNSLISNDDSQFIVNVIEFFLHRPYEEIKFKSCLKETIKFLYDSDIEISIEYE